MATSRHPLLRTSLELVCQLVFQIDTKTYTRSLRERVKRYLHVRGEILLGNPSEKADQ